MPWNIRINDVLLEGKMKAYHNNAALKEQVLQELKHHYDADNFIQGRYWENGKGCAIGCLLKSGNHIEYEERFGIPVHLAQLEDKIFERLPADKAKEWPLQFMSSFEVGKDYSNVVWDFLRWLLIEFLLPKVTGKGKIYNNVRKALRQCGEFLGRGEVAAAAALAADDDNVYAAEQFAEKLIELIKAV